MCPKRNWKNSHLGEIILSFKNHLSISLFCCILAVSEFFQSHGTTQFQKNHAWIRGKTLRATLLNYFLNQNYWQPKEALLNEGSWAIYWKRSTLERKWIFFLVITIKLYNDIIFIFLGIVKRELCLKDAMLHLTSDV